MVSEVNLTTGEVFFMGSEFYLTIAFYTRKLAAINEFGFTN